MLARQLASAACRLGRSRLDFRCSGFPCTWELGSASILHRKYHIKSQASSARSSQVIDSKRPSRFYVSEHLLKNSTAGTTFQLNTEETNHALRVLRLREGACLEVCDGNGGLVLAKLRGIAHNNKAYVETIEDIRQVEWQGPKWEVVAACFSLKGGRADWLVEKCTELGAWGVRPILTVRSPHLGRKQVVIEVATIDEDSEEEVEDVETPNQTRMKRWERVAQSAVKQCLRAHTLAMRKPLHVSSLASIVAAAPLALVGMEGAPPVAQVLQEEAGAVREASLPGAKPGLLLIGPEGDFTPEEVEQLIAAGAKPVGLGPNRLRVETAALALLAATTFCLPSVSSDA
ncbi:g7529 [Coccomyxa elongata]